MKMTVDEIKARVNRIFANSFSAQVYLVLKTDNGFELRIADIEDSTEPELRSMFSESVRGKTRNLFRAGEIVADKA